MNNFNQISVPSTESKCDHLQYAKMNDHFEVLILLTSQQQLTHSMVPFSKDGLHLAVRSTFSLGSPHSTAWLLAPSVVFSLNS